MPKRRSVRKLAVLLAAAALVAPACSSYDNKWGLGDSPVGPHDDSPAEIVNFPNGFMNVATKCNHGNRVYAHTKDAPPVVVPKDPTCPQESSK